MVSIGTYFSLNAHLLIVDS